HHRARGDESRGADGPRILRIAIARRRRAGERLIGILGGGISGISLAAHLDENVEVLEKRQRIGGLCGSIIDQGFTFDAAGPHIMFSKNKEVLNLTVARLGHNAHQRRRENKTRTQGQPLKYPSENALTSLPTG